MEDVLRRPGALPAHADGALRFDDGGRRDGRGGRDGRPAEELAARRLRPTRLSGLAHAVSSLARLSSSCVGRGVERSKVPRFPKSDQGGRKSEAGPARNSWGRRGGFQSFLCPDTTFLLSPTRGCQSPRPPMSHRLLKHCSKATIGPRPFGWGASPRLSCDGDGGPSGQGPSWRGVMARPSLPPARDGMERG